MNLLIDYIYQVKKKEAYEILVQRINGTMSFESSASTLRKTISAPDTSASDTR